ncbi:hypothetical protein [Azohydromonas lata]|uniref:Uncharacterized protein n=1 Tax=Azohydromonas lata TaxID=45677 RepID=A0ABU5IAE8_9BURK|nr:hypothetical protein [Azohydromonas lata]MDZ5456079.1 hypothetical protein [Azohydromonas lata]
MRESYFCFRPTAVAQLAFPIGRFRLQAVFQRLKPWNWLVPEAVSNLLIYYEKAAFYFFVANSSFSLFKKAAEAEYHPEQCLGNMIR